MLLDGHSLAYRAFYALPVENFSTTTGQPTNAVYGFTSMLINALRDERPDYVAVCFDVSRQTFRAERYPEYKANRASAPEDFRGQVELVVEVLAALRIPVLRKAGYEADDLIATLATQAAGEFDVFIVTGDRDALQLVCEDITVLYPRKGVSDMVRYTPEQVEEKYGLTPAQYPDFAALRGDPSDNLPSMPGIGEKTAAKWVREFGSLAALLERAEEVRGKAGETLRAHLDQVRTNRELTELERGVELDLAPADLAWHGWDAEAVHQLFDTLQFRVLRERLASTLGERREGGEKPAEAAPAPPLSGTVLKPGDIGPWLAQHTSDGSRVGLTVAGTWGRGTGRLTGLAFAAAGGITAYVDPTDLDATDTEALAAWLADPALPKVIHDAKGPLLALRAHGFAPQGLEFDTALGAYLVLPGQRSFELPDLASRFLYRELDGAQEDGGQLSFDGADEEAATRRLMSEAYATLDLASVLEAELTAKGGLALLRDVELPLVDVLATMESDGIAVDAARLRELETEFAGEVKHAVEEAHAAVGRSFNLGSPKQLQEILFGELNLPKTKKIKTGYTTDAEALTQLATRTDHPLPVILLRHRDVSKLRTTVEGLIKAEGEDGRIHTTFNQLITTTGRLSSTDPNLQNIPIRTEEGRRIRRAFVPGKGFESLMTADYSQIEMRIMAHLSGDEGLIEAFTTGEDLHTTVASRVFEVAGPEVQPEMRRRIKAMSYGLAYGLSAYGLSQQLGISSSEASALMEEYFQRFGGVRDYLRAAVDRARLSGYTETMFGRRRYLPDLTSDNRQRREMAERMALNAPIQGSAADIMKIAMLRVDRALRERQTTSRLLLQVHDELVLEVAPGERELVEEIVRREMGAAYALDVPLDVAVGVGGSWEDAAH
jgi:DNA polymerase-1